MNYVLIPFPDMGKHCVDIVDFVVGDCTQSNHFPLILKISLEQEVLVAPSEGAVGLESWLKVS